MKAFDGRDGQLGCGTREATGSLVLPWLVKYGLHEELEKLKGEMLEDNLETRVELCESRGLRRVFLPSRVSPKVFCTYQDAQLSS